MLESQAASTQEYADLIYLHSLAGLRVVVLNLLRTETTSVLHVLVERNCPGAQLWT
jgi:hypothetical protein